jgi:hypothetical protein
MKKVVIVVLVVAMAVIVGTTGFAEKEEAQLSILRPATVTTGPATEITLTSATLTGTVNPNGSMTSWWFEYAIAPIGISPVIYGSRTDTEWLNPGEEEVAVRVTLTRLRPYDSYHFRLVAMNSGGTSQGSDQIFTTELPQVSPVVITGLSVSQNPTLLEESSLTFTADGVATEGGDVYYRFDLIPQYGTSDYDPNRDWEIIQGFSEDNSCTYSFEDEGGYVIVARVSATASISSETDPIIGLGVSVVEREHVFVSYINITGLSMDYTQTPQVGDSVTFAAEATHSREGDIYYRFDLIPNYGRRNYDPMNDWETIQGFSTRNTCTHTFAEEGNYVVVVWASATAGIPSGAAPIIGTTVTVEDEQE